MTIEPSPRTAAIAGAWAALGLVPFDVWWKQSAASSGQLKNLVVFVGVVAVFLLLPGRYLVLGTRTAVFRRWWIVDAEERARRAIVTKRMFVWFVSAAVTGTLWSLFLGYVWLR